MSRVRAALACLFVGAAVVTVAACGDDHPPRARGGVSRQAMCARQVSCGSCTPVLGCGWCQLPNGTGRCVDDPNDCQREPIFSWTWEPIGCRDQADASVGGGVDAGRRDADATAGDADDDEPDGDARDARATDATAD